MRSRFLTWMIIPIFFLLLFSREEVQAGEGLSKEKGETREGGSLPKGKISLLRLLHDLGSRHDCYFTIEERIMLVDKEKNPRVTAKLPKDDKQPLVEPKVRWQDRWKYAFSTKRVHGGRDMKSLNKVFASLKLQLPDLEIQRCKANPKFFHLVDKKLLSGKSYLLNRKLQQVRYSGDFTKLPDVLGKLSVKKEKMPLKIVHWPFNIVGAPGGFIYIKLPSAAPEIDINASQVLLRDVLSNYMPLKGKYLRVVWIAQTTTDETPTTSVELRHRADSGMKCTTGIAHHGLTPNRTSCGVRNPKHFLGR